MTSHNIDRTVQPQRVAVSSIKIPTPDIIVLNNGFKVLVINAGSQDLARVEVIFRAGTRFQPKPLVANAAISLLRDGTISRTSQQIAEELDFMEVFLSPLSHAILHRLPFTPLVNTSTAHWMFWLIF